MSNNFILKATKHIINNSESECYKPIEFNNNRHGVFFRLHVVISNLNGGYYTNITAKDEPSHQALPGFKTGQVWF